MCFPQGRALLSRLQGLKAKGIQLKISSGMIDSTELDTLSKHSQLLLLLSLYDTFRVCVQNCCHLLDCSLSLFVLLSSYLTLSVFHFDPVSLCLYSVSWNTCNFLYPRLYFSCFPLSFTRSLFLSHSLF